MTPVGARQEAIGAILARAPVVPVVTLEDADAAVGLAETLLEAGLAVIEVTLRTPAAADALGRIAAAVPAIALGAGTVTSLGQLRRAVDLGADFAVSPGFTPRLIEAAAGIGLPWLPGASTAAESQQLLEAGYRYQKFFPAEACGGTAWLRAMAAPLPQACFCPTGGVGAANAARYLDCPNVACVGGSWVAPGDAIASGDWDRVRELARAAAALRAPG